MFWSKSDELGNQVGLFGHVKLNSVNAFQDLIATTSYIPPHPIQATPSAPTLNSCSHQKNLSARALLLDLVGSG
ncbi:hypothetical protein SUGI_0174910 [Cryptomeria japonica]|nr:hypothetical protein SUGI_0174910 [Cryptomeria japonica]